MRAFEVNERRNQYNQISAGKIVRIHLNYYYKIDKLMLYEVVFFPHVCFCLAFYTCI